MTNEEKAYFSLLKQAVSKKLQEKYPAMNATVEFWKGQEIAFFQDDLQEKCKSTISEKWFYTHLKGKNEKLPRIDMLNLLSQYAGYHDWNSFIASQSENADNSTKNNKTPHNFFTKTKLIRYTIFSLAALLTGIALYITTHENSYTYSFCFIDADMKTKIAFPIEVVLLNDKESARSFVTDSNACFTVRTPNKKITFFVKNPYYQHDTIIRICNENTNQETISLQTNDFAMMVQYFAKSKEKDWSNMRQKLEAIFHDNARIYQIHGHNKIGVELFTKDEFIKKLSLPTRSLKDMKIIETRLKNNKISVLRFIQEADGIK